MIDNLFLLAVASIGLGLSLATYRLFADRHGWPMGSLHADMPWLPALIGLVAFLLGLMFAVARGSAAGGWGIILFGALLAVFWTGFLRVGSQISLFLAPIAAALLLMTWFAVPLSYDRAGWNQGDPGAFVGSTYYDNKTGKGERPARRSEGNE